MVSERNSIQEGSKSLWYFLPFSLRTNLSKDRTKSSWELLKKPHSLQVPLCGGIDESLVPVLQPIHAGVFLIFLEVVTGLFSFFFFLLKSTAFNSPGAEGSLLLNHKVCHTEM